MNYTPLARQLVSHEDAIALEMERIIVQNQVYEWLKDAISKFDLKAELTKFAKARLGMIGDELTLPELPGVDLYAKLEINPEHAEEFKRLFRKQVQQEAGLFLNSLGENARQLDSWKK